MLKKDKGFTLVELAIVLVIIGLILAAVLKGQEMITNAKVKGVANDLRGVSAAYYSYQDRYKAIPGDDSNATAHLGQTAIAGNGDGIITGTFVDDPLPTTAISTESGGFWQQTRMAGFTTGVATATTAQAGTNSVDGLLGVQAGTTAAPVLGMVGNVVCSGNIPWKIAQAVDIILDDGNSDTGNVRAGGTAGTANSVPGTTAVSIYGTTAADATGAAATTPDTIYTVCMKI